MDKVNKDAKTGKFGTSDASKGRPATTSNQTGKKSK